MTKKVMRNFETLQRNLAYQLFRPKQMHRDFLEHTALQNLAYCMSVWQNNDGYLLRKLSKYGLYEGQLWHYNLSYPLTS